MDFFAQAELVARLLVAAALGAVIGFERERRERPAGFRTFILVSLGSALFGIISLTGYAANLGDNVVDGGRVAAQVVTGIGFLGAGAVVRGNGSVRGLTTAASIWAVAAIGLAVGAGLYLLGTAATLIVALTLGFLRRVEYRIGPSDRNTHSESPDGPPQEQVIDVIETAQSDELTEIVARKRKKRKKRRDRSN